MTARLPDYDKVALLLPMDGANNGTVFADWGPAARTVTRAGDARTSTAQSLHYGSSGFFDGSGDYLVCGTSPDFAVGAGDFTVRAKAYIAGSGVARLCGLANGNTAGVSNGFAINIRQGGSTNKMRFFNYGSNTSTDGTNNVPLNEWVDIEVSRSGSTIKAFVNGVQEFSITDSTNFTGSVLFVGSDAAPLAGTPSNPTTAMYMQDFLLVNGVALHSTGFTAPARLVGEISGTIYDPNGDPTERRIVAFPRAVPSRVFQTTSDDTTGAYSVRVPATECSRVVLAEDVSDPLYNDLIDRVIAA